MDYNGDYKFIDVDDVHKYDKEINADRKVADASGSICDSDGGYNTKEREERLRKNANGK